MEICALFGGCGGIFMVVNYTIWPDNNPAFTNLTTSHFIKDVTFFLVVALLNCPNFLLGEFLWELRPWARLASIFLSVVSLVFCILAIFLAQEFVVTIVVGLALNSYLIWVLTRPDVKAAFIPIQPRPGPCPIGGPPVNYGPMGPTQGNGPPSN
jgi:hypothetical protein